MARRGISASVVCRDFKLKTLTQEKVIEIVAGFLKVPVESVSTATVIDRSAVSSSILLHRMYAKLHAEGISVSDYQQIKTVSHLLQKAGLAGNSTGVTTTPVAAVPQFVGSNHSTDNGHAVHIGLDIEQIAALPRTDDFREEAFYTTNFSPEEIARCILQPDPYASFAGLFAAKEAIVKADNTFRAASFSQILISHTPDGKPVFRDWAISITHSADTAAAVAIPPIPAPAPARVSEPAPTPGFPTLAWVLVLLSILLSLTSLFYRH